ncbi:lanthionine synthetase C family protein [Dictyobacter vulcani]|uniref:lanthionine synthetase C family protein n=1 Tax=Dictyobacter vulcani TaxID=2607529 RepID=UPI001387552B|nr:lanthionine synthetase C family protein [Dictyobacter vulcani]
MTQYSWMVSVDPSLCERVFQVILPIADRLADPDVVTALTHDVDPLYWWDASLAAGFPGLALFYLFLARGTQEKKWLDVAYVYLDRAVEATHTHPLDRPNLSKGTAGMTLLLSLFCDQDERFTRIRHDLDERLARQVLDYNWWMSIDNQLLLQYDLIVGVSGALASLVRTGVHRGIIQEAIERLIHHLLQFVTGEKQHYQRWAVPATFFPTARQRYLTLPVINCGLAHGIPGPLVALSLAWQTGYRIDGQFAAMQMLASWLASHYVTTPWGIDWPDIIPIRSSPEPERFQVPARSGWCYGAPGVLRSLQIAGQALSDVMLQKQILHGLDALIMRPIESRQVDPLTLCHGQSGLLLISTHFFQETGRSDVRDQITRLVERILAEVHMDTPVGFRYVFRPGHSVNSPGLFLGVSGTLLALLAASTNIAPVWDRALLLS